MNRVYIKTYGCQMNERDSDAVAAMLRGRGYRIVQTEDDCDIMLLNTCSVRDAAEQKALGKAGYVVQRKKRNPDFILGILGCMAQNRGAEILERLPDVDLVIGTQKFHQVPGYLDNIRAAREAGLPVGASVVDIAEEPGSQNTIKDHYLPEPVLAPDGTAAEPAPQVSAFVSIQQGCNMDCAFCIVPKTRGDERSRPMDEIVAECAALAARGVREITLLGQIVTSYGRRDYIHTDGVSPFVQLIERVHALEGIARIRFTSPHPRGFKDDLVAAYARLPKLCPYVHLPLQSGSNRILKAMNRPYTRERYKEIVDALRASQPGMYFSTDVIVGFPGETEADVEELCGFIRDTKFERLGVFRYSQEEGTKAAKMDEQLSPKLKEARYHKTMSLQREIAAQVGQAFVGKTLRVLVEEPGVARGEADAPDIDGRVYVPRTLPVGEFAEVTITGARDYDLLALPKGEKPKEYKVAKQAQ